MELHITGLEDLNQLQGFTVSAMELQRLEDNTPVIHIVLTSPYYEKPYDMRFIPTVDIQLKAGGRHIDTIPGIQMRSKSVEATDGKSRAP